MRDKLTDYAVYAYKKGVELPKEGTYYVMAENGCFLHKDKEIVSGFVPVEDVPILEELNIKQQVNCHLPKLPEEFVYKIQRFFKEIVYELGTEANVILYYNSYIKEYRLFIPPQKTSHGSVNYEKQMSKKAYLKAKGFLCVGTIHSHCNFSAFHSGTDVKDEEEFDGLHVTFGNNDKKVFTISASIVMNGCRKQVCPTQYLEGVMPFENSKTHFVFNDNDNQKKWDQEIQNWFENVTKVK